MNSRLLHRKGAKIAKICSGASICALRTFAVKINTSKHGDMMSQNKAMAAAVFCKKNALMLAVLIFGALLWGTPAGLWAAEPVGKNSAAVQDDPAAQLQARRSAIDNEQAAIARERSEIEALPQEHERKLKALASEGMTSLMLEKAELEANQLRVRLKSIEVDQQDAQRDIETLESAIVTHAEQIKGLKSAPAEAVDHQARMQHIARLQTDLDHKQALLQLEKQHLVNLQNSAQVVKERHAVSLKWLQDLQQLYLAQQEVSGTEALEDLEARLEKERQQLQQQAGGLHKWLEQIKGDDPKSKAECSLLEAQIQDAEERARLKRIELSVAHARSRLESFAVATMGGETTPTALKGAFDQADLLLRDLESTRKLLAQKISVIEQQRELADKRSSVTPEVSKLCQQETQVLEKLIQDLQKKSDGLSAIIQLVQAQRDQLKSRYEQSIEHSLKVRRRLPSDIAAWRDVGLELLLLPKVISHQAVETAREIGNTLRNAGISRLLLIVSLEMLWLVLIAWLRNRLRKTMDSISARERSFSVNLALMALQLLCWNMTAGAIAGASVLFLVLAGIPKPATGIVSALALTLVALKASVDLAWLLLVAPSVPEERRHPILYRRSRGALVFAALLTAVTVLVYFLPTSMTMKDLFSRLFMLFLLLVALVVLHSRRLILTPFDALFFGHPLWIRSAHLISLLVPATVLMGATVGLAGYVNLAWTISIYVGWFVLVLVGWLLLRGLLKDLVMILKNQVHARSDKGLVWTQGVVDPLYRMTEIALFVAAWWLLFQLYGWDRSSPAVRAINGVLTAPLLTIGGRPFHALDLVLTGLIVWLVMLAARWSREVTYRWVYSKVSDVGARHSLSVFTQYAVVLIGVLTALRIVGIDLTAFAIFAGALGVGVGLGLQNIANNFISGILLLIERPLRAGDFVTIGNNEGEVTRIGIRSLTLKTRDNQEIIIPNAEVISHQFTNWTHTDSTVRIKLEVGVSYDSDPYQARRIIEEVLEEEPMVLEYPAPRVWLKEYGDSALIFRVHFFIDVRRTWRWESKSAILFRIWDQFQEAGIEIPYPQREIAIKGLAEKGGKELLLAQGHKPAADKDEG